MCLGPLLTMARSAYFETGGREERPASTPHVPPKSLCNRDTKHVVAVSEQNTRSALIAAAGGGADSCWTFAGYTCHNEYTYM